MNREKVIKGLECCLPMTTRNGLADCKKCPYDRKNTLEGGITECCHDLMADALALLKEYDEALKLMVYQYCTMKPLTVHDEVFHNKFMSAGEAAFRLLGLENGQSTDGVWERWFPNG